MVIATFSTRGAVLKSWRLKNYHDGTGAPLELIPQNVPNSPRPFTLDVDDAPTTATLQNALYKPSTEALTVGSAPASLAFDTATPLGSRCARISPSRPNIRTWSRWP